MNDEDRRGDAASVAAADDRDQAQRREFGSLLEQHLLRFYGERLARGGGDELQVIGSRPDADGLIVTSQVVRREGPPISVAWRLADANGVYKITDVTIDGVSMALSERAEFSARIARDGGQFDGLLATLRREGPAVGSSVPPPYPSTASGDGNDGRASSPYPAAGSACGGARGLSSWNGGTQGRALYFEHYRRLFDTNVLGTVLTIRKGLAYFGPNGSVINIGSVASVSPSPDSVIYAATKGAVGPLSPVCWPPS